MNTEIKEKLEKLAYKKSIPLLLMLQGSTNWKMQMLWQ